ncbi:MAG: hypothetical protein ACHQQ3_06010 [Gemmatimonadales bacterium]
MRHLSPTRRLLVAALAVVQMAVPALVAIADAELASRSAGAQVHIEDHTRRACTPAHPDDCALCQFLSSLSSERGSGVALPVALAATTGPVCDSSRLPAWVAVALQRTRAPPVG